MTLRAVLYFRAKVTPLQKCRCAILTPTAEETNFPSKSPAEEINFPSYSSDRCQNSTATLLHGFISARSFTLLR